MAFVETYTLDGGARGPLHAMHKEDLVLVPVGLSFGAGDTYVTGGLTVTLPDELEELQLVDIIFTQAHDGTRRWEWDGSRSAPMILAYDAFATEEGNATDIAAVTLRMILVLK